MEKRSIWTIWFWFGYTAINNNQPNNEHDSRLLTVRSPFVERMRRKNAAISK